MEHGLYAAVAGLVAHAVDDDGRYAASPLSENDAGCGGDEVGEGFFLPFGASAGFSVADARGTNGDHGGAKAVGTAEITTAMPVPVAAVSASCDSHRLVGPSGNPSGGVAVEDSAEAARMGSPKSIKHASSQCAAKRLLSVTEGAGGRKIPGSRGGLCRLPGSTVLHGNQPEFGSLEIDR